MYLHFRPCRCGDLKPFSMVGLVEGGPQHLAACKCFAPRSIDAPGVQAAGKNDLQLFDMMAGLWLRRRVLQHDLLDRGEQAEKRLIHGGEANGRPYATTILFAHGDRLKFPVRWFSVRGIKADSQPNPEWGMGSGASHFVSRLRKLLGYYRGA